MKVLVTGATGYIGGRLVPELLKHGQHVRCFVRTPAKLSDVPWREAVEVVSGDLNDEASMTAALSGVDVAYYLVHSMGGVRKAEFARRDRSVAIKFRVVAAAARVRRIIYLGGLGREEEDLSTHLRSRHEVGRVLADGPVSVTELRAAIIVGSGSASFEMLRHLVDKLPVMIAPLWVRTRCQPIAIEDVLYYLSACLDAEETAGQLIEIGGPDVITYQQLMQIYAQRVGLGRRYILPVPVPVLTPKLSSLWVGLVTPLPTGVARPLVEGLANEVVVTTPTADAILPHKCLSISEAIDVAIKRTRDLEVVTSWAGAEIASRTPADPVGADPDWSGGTVLDDTQSVTSSVDAHDLFKSVCALGGDRGWLANNWLWSLRGWIDKLFGGVGLRRGRRHPDELRVGDAVDFWRVEALVPDTLLRLRAEMRLPGRAWLEWTIESDHKSGITTLVQRARFQPRGLWGRLYWYGLSPFHRIIFRRLAVALVSRGMANGVGVNERSRS